MKCLAVDFFGLSCLMFAQFLKSVGCCRLPNLGTF